jgi:glycosyltransferase involved in cell wall biosynthesis
MRLTLLTEIPAPFRLPLFNALAAEDGIDLQVLFLSEEDPRRTHYRFYADELRASWRVLHGRSIRRGGVWLILNRGVVRALERQRPDVVIVGGWNQPAFWVAALWCRARHRKLVVWIESTSGDARSGLALLERAKRWFARHSDAALVPGRLSAEFAHGLGTPRDRIRIAPNAIDGEIFGERVAERRAHREQLRADLGISGFVVLYVGRLDVEKGLDTLIESMRDVLGTLVLVGGGETEQELRALAGDDVRFTGPLERDALVDWYAAADAFVLPSISEPWGMVLNEAAAAGLPLVATDAAGAAHELIEDGRNGFRVPAGDRGALNEALGRLADDETLRAAAGQRSLEVARRFTPEAWAAAVAAATRDLL